MGACRRTTGISEASLRWHYPDQVQRVFLTHARLSAGPLAVLPCGSGRIIACQVLFAETLFCSFFTLLPKRAMRFLHAIAFFSRPCLFRNIRAPRHGMAYPGNIFTLP